jgi:hypothetical protein
MVYVFGRRRHQLTPRTYLSTTSKFPLFCTSFLSFRTSFRRRTAESADEDISDDELMNDRKNESAVSDHSSGTDNGNESSEDEQFDEEDDSSVSSSTEDEHDNANFPPSLQTQGISAFMGKCRTIVSTIRKFSILSECIHTLAGDSSIKAGLVIDMRVRWNSSYKMLQRILLYQSILEKLYDELDSLPGVTHAQRKKLFDSRITGNDWHLVQALRRVLERFDEATKVLSGLGEVSYRYVTE